MVQISRPLKCSFHVPKIKYTLTYIKNDLILLGKGELLKLALELGDACQKKKSRPLAVSYVYIDVDFSKQVEVNCLLLFIVDIT